MTNFHHIALLSGIVNLLLAFFVLFINPARRLNQIFCLLGLGLASWGFGCVSLSNVESASDALFRIKLLTMGVIIVPAAFFHFGMETAEVQRGRWMVVPIYIVSAFFMGLNFTPYFIAGIQPRGSWWTSIAGPGYWAFSCGFVPAATLAAITILFRALSTAKPSKARSVKILLIITSVVLLGGTHDMLRVLGLDYSHTRFPVIPWGMLSVSCYGMVMAYSILSDQLFDVRVSLSRHTATILRFCFLGAIAYVLLVTVSIFYPAAFTRVGFIASLATLLLSAAITAQFFPKLFGGLSEQLSQRFLGDQFEYRDKLTAFINSAPAINDTQRLLDSVADLVFDNMELSVVRITILGSDPKCEGQSIRPAHVTRSSTATLGIDSPFIAFFKTTGLSQIDCTLPSGDDDTQRVALSLLKSESLEAAFSIAIRPKSPTGLLVIGPRRDGRPLTKLDSDLLQALCRVLAFQTERIAIIQTEELREANKAKDQFLASINHEMRNPLNGITGIVKILSENIIDPQQRFLLSTLKGCAEQLRSTMDEVLSFNENESQPTRIKNTDTDIVELVRTTCAIYDRPTNPVLIEAPTAPFLLHCDAGKIRQILSNYIANALKYGSPPEAHVHVSVLPSTPEHTIVTLTVTSKGATLSPEEIATLFTALTRGRRARETNAHGMGLGLAICKKLAEAMGGTVGVESRDGKTSFWFKARYASVSASPRPEPASQRNFAGRRVLVIEDEPYNRLVLDNHLVKLGFLVAWAEDGASALALINEPIDVIMMDWVLPDIEGGDLVRQMKSNRSGPLPPIIVVSAYSVAAKRAECLAAGATEFISKPIDSKKLVAALERSQGVAV